MTVILMFMIVLEYVEVQQSMIHVEFVVVLVFYQVIAIAITVH